MKQHKFVGKRSQEPDNLPEAKSSKLAKEEIDYSPAKSRAPWALGFGIQQYSGLRDRSFMGLKSSFCLRQLVFYSRVRRAS